MTYKNFYIISVLSLDLFNKLLVSRFTNVYVSKTPIMVQILSIIFCFVFETVTKLKEIESFDNCNRQNKLHIEID